MATADPQAKWLMQAWLFYDNQEFWKPPQIKVCAAFLAAAGCFKSPQICKRHAVLMQWQTGMTVFTDTPAYHRGLGAVSAVSNDFFTTLLSDQARLMRHRSALR